MSSIEANDLWLKFNIQFKQSRLTMRQFLIHAVKPRAFVDKFLRQDSVFWALRGVSFKVEPGEIVGLLGHNGAGKSTLLRTLAGIYTPNKGTVEIKGRVGTLLSLGGGFTPRLSGLENIEQSSILMGIHPRELAGKIDEILEMADLGEFIHAPLRTYSSGMRARLGFSLAVHMDPEIILLDEVLEAGDQKFRNKCSSLLETFASRGKSVVIASHNMATLQKFCGRVILLDHGEVAAQGMPEEIIPIYQERSKKNSAPAPAP